MSGLPSVSDGSSQGFCNAVSLVHSQQHETPTHIECETQDKYGRRIFCFWQNIIFPCSLPTKCICVLSSEDILWWWQGGDILLPVQSAQCQHVKRESTLWPHLVRPDIHWTWAWQQNLSTNNGEAWRERWQTLWIFLEIFLAGKDQPKATWIINTVELCGEDLSYFKLFWGNGDYW